MKKSELLDVWPELKLAGCLFARGADVGRDFPSNAPRNHTFSIDISEMFHGFLQLSVVSSYSRRSVTAAGEKRAHLLLHEHDLTINIVRAHAWASGE
jgi:hypothetical protein